MRQFSPLLFLIGFLAARPTPAYADHVLLTYGDRVSGRIISVSKEVVRRLRLLESSISREGTWSK